MPTPNTTVQQTDYITTTGSLQWTDYITATGSLQWMDYITTAVNEAGGGSGGVDMGRRVEEG